MQIGFVGLGKMGGNMVAPHQARLRPRRRRLRLQRGGASRRPRSTARAAPRSLEDLVSKLERAAHGLDHGPGRRPDAADRRRARRAARRGRHDRRRRQLEAGPTTRRAPSRSKPQGIHYVDVGTSGGVWGLEVGYCMMVGGPDEAVERLAPILDVLAPPPTEEHGPGWRHFGPTRRGPLREDGPQRRRVRADAGLRRGLRPLRQVRVRPRQREDRAPVDAGLGRALVAVRARRPRLRAGGQRPRRPRRRTSTTPARAAGRSRTRSTCDVPTPVITGVAVRALLLARQRRLHRQGPRGAAQPVRRPRDRRSRRVTADRRAARAQENPLTEGLERLPVHPTTLVIFGATGDLAKRKLLPALYNLAHEGALPERFNLIGVLALATCPHEEFREQAREAINAVLAPRARREGARRAAGARALRPGTFDDADVYEQLGKPLEEFDDEAGDAAQPRLLPLHGAGVLPGDRRGARRGTASTTTTDAEVRVVIEKPFGTTSPRPRELNQRGAVGLPTSARSSASTTTWARRRSRTCWRSASPTACSSRSGTATTSTTCRSRRRRTSASAARAGYYDSAGRAARPRPEPHAAAAVPLSHGAAGLLHRRRGARREGQGAARDPRRRPPRTSPRWPCARSTPPARSAARTSPATSRRRASAATRSPRPTRRCACRSTTGAGPACRSTCAPASGWRARSPRSR